MLGLHEVVSVRSCHSQLKWCFVLTKTSIPLISSMKNGVKLGNSSHPLTCLQKGIFESTKWLWRAVVGSEVCCSWGRGSCGVKQVSCGWKLEGSQALQPPEPLSTAAVTQGAPSASWALFTTACYSLRPYVFGAVNSVFHNMGWKRQYSNREGRHLPSTLTITDFWLCPASPWGLKTSQV